MLKFSSNNDRVWQAGLTAAKKKNDRSTLAGSIVFAETTVVTYFSRYSLQSVTRTHGAKQNTVNVLVNAVESIKELM